MPSADQWLAIAGIAASPLTGVVGFFLGYAARRPRLQLTGTGSGSNPVGSRDLVLSHVTLYNNPAFIRRWIRVSRQSANLTEARLYDPELGELVGHLLLWGLEGTNRLSREATIESGKQGRLYVFAKDRYADEYFTYHADNLASDPSRSPARYTEKKKRFGLVIRDVNGRQFKYRLIVRNTDQSVSVSLQPQLRDRIRAVLRRL